MCARTLAAQSGMANQWIKDQGLLHVKELWENIRKFRHGGIR